MSRKKVVYISGPITGVKNYWEAFERAEEDLIGLGYIPLSPAHLPEGMTKEQYMRINFALIDSADAVAFLPEWERSEGAQLERNYCHYTGKPMAALRAHDGKYSRGTLLMWFERDLDAAIGIREHPVR